MAFKTATKTKAKLPPVTNRSKAATKKPLPMKAAGKKPAGKRTIAAAAKKTGKATAKAKR